MYYTISTVEKRFDIVSPDETVVINRIRIYHDDGRFIKGVSVIADTQLLFEDEKPEDLAKMLEIWRKGMIYLPGSEKVEDMIKFLREHSKELWKGKLQCCNSNTRNSWQMIGRRLEKRRWKKNENP